MAGSSTPAHVPRRLVEPYPRGWILYASTSEHVERLIVFVHGFRGQAVATWQQFADSGSKNGWWRTGDMLYVGYDSVRESITGVASRLREHLPSFYPRLPQELLEVDGTRPRPESSIPYRQLILVGHSLGGVVVRRALSDVAQGWLDDRIADGAAEKPPLLDANVRLFSPASAGFRSAGWLGIAQATSVWVVVNMFLRRSSAYSDLQPGSEILTSTRRRTEKLVASNPDELSGLRAAILWANPDEVVLAERYDSDYVDHFADQRTHSTVCKPSDAFALPWHFVETGKPH